MSDGLDYIPAADEVWPPSPALPPPKPERPQPFIARHSVLACVLISIGAGAFGFGAECLLQLAITMLHVIAWDSAATAGGTVFATQIVIQFWLRSRFLKQKRGKNAGSIP